MKLKLRYTTLQPQVLERQREMELTESELQILLDRIGTAVFNQQPTARDLIDYLHGRGEFAIYVDIAARHKDVRYLWTRVASDAHYTQPDRSVIGYSIVEEGDEGDFRATAAMAVT